jgi:hypothetical protein
MNTYLKTAAPAFIHSKIQSEKHELYTAWISEIPENYFERFLEKGVKPFLARFGYRLGFSQLERVRILRAWAFAHVQTQRLVKYHGNYITLVKYAHEGGQEEYDWFTYIISHDDWDALAQEWYSTDFLDDSDPGVSQRLDLPRVLWSMISLEGSRAHQQWLDVVMDTADQEDAIQEDSHIAFTGNRRTFS